MPAPKTHGKRAGGVASERSASGKGGVGGGGGGVGSISGLHRQPVKSWCQPRTISPRRTWQRDLRLLRVVCGPGLASQGGPKHGPRCDSVRICAVWRTYLDAMGTVYFMCKSIAGRNNFRRSTRRTSSSKPDQRWVNPPSSSANFGCQAQGLGMQCGKGKAKKKKKVHQLLQVSRGTRQSVRGHAIRNAPVQFCLCGLDMAPRPGTACIPTCAVVMR
jgi:hypothetical protein